MSTAASRRQAPRLASPASSPPAAPEAGASTSTCEACGWRWTTDGAAVCPACKRMGRCYSSERAETRAHKPWTPAEDNRLKWDWGTFSIVTLAKRMGRTEHGIYQRARKLRLALGAPAGSITVHEAARRLGFDRKTIMKVLREGGAKVVRGWSDPTYAKRAVAVRVVNLDEAIAAAEAWLAKESVYRLAPRIGVSHTQLRMLLIRAGEVPPPPRAEWRVSEVRAREVVAAWLANWRRGRKPKLLRGLASPTAPAESGVTTRARGAVGTVSRRAA